MPSYPRIVFRAQGSHRCVGRVKQGTISQGATYFFYNYSSDGALIHSTPPVPLCYQPFGCVWAAAELLATVHPARGGRLSGGPNQGVRWVDEGSQCGVLQMVRVQEVT